MFYIIYKQKLRELKRDNSFDQHVKHNYEIYHRNIDSDFSLSSRSHCTQVVFFKFAQIFEDTKREVRER